MPGLFGNFVFPCPGVVFREKVGYGMEDGRPPVGPPVLFTLLQPWLPRIPRESLLSLCPVSMGLAQLPWGWPSLPALPLRGNWSFEESPHSFPFPFPGTTVNSCELGEAPLGVGTGKLLDP